MGWRCISCVSKYSPKKNILLVSLCAFKCCAGTPFITINSVLFFLQNKMFSSISKTSYSRRAKQFIPQ